MYYITDGQSIAARARLAKKISSSTSTLKRTVSRFNGMRHDQFEEVAYHLPANLNWETVSNLEELSTLEVASAGNCTIPIQPFPFNHSHSFVDKSCESM